MKSGMRTLIGTGLVGLGLIGQISADQKAATLASGLLVLMGLMLLLPAIKAIKKRLFKGEEDEADKKSMSTAKFFYVGAAMVGLMGLTYQGELKSKGYILVGRGGSYSISGSDAEQQVTACWIGAGVSLSIAMFLHLRARLRQH